MPSEDAVNENVPAGEMKREDTRSGRSTRYRGQAAACRANAGSATTQDARDDYLRMAAEWDKLADEVHAWSKRIGEGSARQ